MNESDGCYFSVKAFNYWCSTPTSLPGGIHHGSMCPDRACATPDPSETTQRLPADSHGRLSVNEQDIVLCKHHRGVEVVCYSRVTLLTLSDAIIIF